MGVVFDLLRAIVLRILIPDKEWDLLGAHFGSEKESLKGLNLSVCLSVWMSLFANYRAQFLPDHLGRYLKLSFLSLKRLHLSSAYLANFL